MRAGLSDRELAEQMHGLLTVSLKHPAIIRDN